MSCARRLALLAVLVAVPLLPASASGDGSCITAAVHFERPADAPSAACAVAVLTATPNPVDPASGIVTFDGCGSVGADGQSASDIATYSWDFGDTVTTDTALASVQHTYVARGHYVASLMIEESGGNPLAAPASIDVYVSLMPVAAFSQPGGTLRPNVDYAFDPSASTAPGGSIVSYQWNWGDGTTSQTLPAAPVAHHTFAADGASTGVTLKVVNDVDLQSAPVTHAIVVQNQLPLVQLTATPTTVAIGQQTTLSAAGSSDPDGAIVEYRWDLDANGSFETSTGLTPTVVAGGFPNAGVMQLRVKAIDDSAGATVRTVTVTVSGTDGTGGGSGGDGSGSGGGGGKSGGKQGGGSSGGGGSAGSLGRITGDAFAVGLGGNAIQKLRRVLRRGIALQAATNRVATGTLTLTLSARDARRLHLIRHGRKPVKVGTLRTALSAGKPVKRSVKLTRKAARILKHRHPRLLRVTITGTLTAGTAHASAARVVLLRG
jgi:PKD repeat protein